MKIRRFFAKDMRTALKQVAAELGPDAAILSSNQVTGGVELVAATDYDEAIIQARNDDFTSRPQATSQPVANEGSSAGRVNNSAANAQKNATEAELKAFLEKTLKLKPKSKAQTASTDEPLITDSSASHREDESYFESSGYGGSSSQASPAFPKIEWSQEPTLVSMREELNLLRQLLQEQMAQLTEEKQEKLSPIGAALRRELAQQGLHKGLIENLVQQCQTEQDYECAWQKSLALLSKQIVVGENEILERGGVVALVGPTGVGKTTTIAKLAAKQVLKHGAGSVALISTDSYRVAAHEQLKTFARILQIPVRTVNDEKDLRDALYHFADKKLVLVDTAGMSQRDERMSQQMQCLASENIAIRHYLVLSATSQLQVLNDAIRLFKPFNLCGCVLTKLDEAASLGEIISTIIDNNLKVVYTTDGQRVPEDIRIARAHHLVSKMVWLTRQHHQDQHQQATGT